MGDIGEDEDFGMTGEEGLRDGEFDGKAGVVFAVDEECGYLKLLEDMGARGAAGHAELGCDDALGLGFETLVAEVFDFLFKEGLFAWVEEVGDKVDDVAGAVGLHLLAGLHATFDDFIGVGQGVRVEQGESTEVVREEVGEGECDISAHGMAEDDALFDTGVVEDSLDSPCHKVHGMLLTIGLAVAMAGEVDGDDVEVTHIGKDIGTPDVEILHVAVEEDEGLGVLAAFVSVVQGVILEDYGFMLFHCGGFSVYVFRLRWRVVSAMNKRECHFSRSRMATSGMDEREVLFLR